MLQNQYYIVTSSFNGGLDSSASLISSNYVKTLTPPSGVAAADRVLIADVTISLPGQNNENLRNAYQYTGINGGWSSPHRTSHMKGPLPAGGNLCMLDGHVEWHAFSDMHVRTASSGTPVFWW